MIRLVYLLRRRPELSLAAFHRTWLDDHGPLVASFRSSLRIARYVQTHRLDEPELEAAMAAARGGMEPPYDGVAELWWESEDDLRAASATDEGRAASAALVEDERRFIDLAASPLWLAHEYPQVNPPHEVVARPRTGVAKLHFPLRHLPVRTLEDAQRYWRVQHGPLIRRQALAAGLLRYQQVHRYETPLEASLRAARGTAVDTYTGHAEAWVDLGARRTGTAAREASARAVDDERTFIDLGRSSMWFGVEHVVIDWR
jgi:uncharacterized protein (TIGR02118 family)